MKNNYSLFCYSLPDSDKIYSALCKTYWTESGNLANNCFYLTPFDNKGKVLKFKIIKSFDHTVDVFQNWHFYDSDFIKTDKNDFIELVNKAKLAIRQKNFAKVVASRQTKIALPDNFSPFEFFISLTKRYPNAFVSLISCPEFGTWTGASPELLISATENKYELYSLAGTFSKSQQNDNFVEDKNRKEQEMVSVFIREKLKDCNLTFSEKGPELFEAGNIKHFRTIFKVEQSNPECGLKLIQELHPTPAICGYPYIDAKQFIDENEPNKRELYGGFLGNFNNAKDFWFYVNLRCMKILKNEAVLYAGAGIVDESDAETEWIETENKMNTLRSLLY